MMRIPIGLGQPAVEAIELIASGDKVVMSVKAPGVPGGYEVLALVVWPGSVDVEAGHAELGFHRCHR